MVGTFQDYMNKNIGEDTLLDKDFDALVCYNTRCPYMPNDVTGF
jgi:hypothetical protein